MFGPLALDVPERHVDAAHRVEQHRAVPPVRADVRRLPDVLDLVDVAADQERLQVLVDGRLHHAGALGERGTAQAVEARLARRDLDDRPAGSRLGAVRIVVMSVIFSGGRPRGGRCRLGLGWLPRGPARRERSRQPAAAPADSQPRTSRRSMIELLSGVIAMREGAPFALGAGRSRRRQSNACAGPPQSPGRRFAGPLLTLSYGG